MNDQEIAIVFAMKGLKDTQKMKKRVTNKDYADAVKNYRVTTTGTGTAPSESAISKLLNGKSQKKIDKRKNREPQKYLGFDFFLLIFFEKMDFFSKFFSKIFFRKKIRKKIHFFKKINKKKSNHSIKKMTILLARGC